MITEVAVAQHQFTIRDYHRMGETGIFTEDDRVELLNGQIYTVSPVGSKHAACVKRINRSFGRNLADEAIVSVHNPVVLNDYSEPEPDVALLFYRDDFYEERLPTAADVLLLIEVSDATLRFDKDVKLPLYAQSAIPEVWIIDLKKACIEVYVNPRDGAYQEQQTRKRGQELTLQQLPFLTVTVQELLG